MKNYSLLAVGLAAVIAQAGGVARAEVSRNFANPILPGFYPDPSVCRVGSDFYLVTSTFEYFPGVPIFHSRDLVNWEQIGHVLDRPSQLPLDGVGASDGIYAPTLRCHDGTFYMITTLVTRKPKDKYTNFVVTAKNPAGPWSEPFILSDSYWRIDPSLFFDDDGKAYMTANRTVDPIPYKGHRLIGLQQLDLQTMKLTGPMRDIGEAVMRTAEAPEAPHLYKKNGTYYLLIAEGGTFETHSVVVSRSKDINGPYAVNPANPILTHRHLGPGQEIHSVGHADLIEAAPGQWWMVALGMRGVGDHCCNLGRETFLTPVSWDKDAWPVVNPGYGRIRGWDRRPELPVFDAWTPPTCDHFEGKKLGPQWNFLRTPRDDFWSLTKRPSYLRLNLKKETIADVANPAFVGRRVQHPSYTVRTRMEFRPHSDHEVAGLVVRNGNHHLRVVKSHKGAVDVLSLVSHGPGAEKVLAEATVPPGPLYLKIDCRRETDYTVSYGTEPERWTVMNAKADGRILGHKAAPGGMFTGSYVGMYASSQGAGSSGVADFDWFEYKPE